MIRNISQNDAQQIADIYNYYIKNTIVTFEEKPVNKLIMKERIQAHNTSLPWLVYAHDNKILGYAYAVQWKKRSAYQFSAESTVYLKEDEMGQGIGTSLYKELLLQLQQKNIHAVIGGIALPNKASIALHEKFGFEKVAHFKEVGYKFKQWIDVGYWQLFLK